MNKLQKQYCDECGYEKFNKYNENEYTKWLEERLKTVSNSLCKHRMTRNPKEHQENKCRLCKKPYQKITANAG